MKQPLTPQQVEVRLGKLDRKTSSKLSIPGSLQVAQNVVMTKTGRLERRSGSVLWDSLQGVERMHAGEREFLVATAAAVHSDIDGTLQARGSIAAMRTDHTPIGPGTSEQWSHTHVRHAGFDWHAWQESGGIYYAVRDAETGAYLVVDGVIQLGVNNTRPLLLAVGDYVVCVFIVSTSSVVATSINAVRIPVATPAVPGAMQVIDAGNQPSTVGNGAFDAVAISTTTIAVVYIPGGLTAYRLRTWNVATQSTVATLTGAGLGYPTGAPDRFCIGIMRYDASAGYHVAVATQQAGSGAGGGANVRLLTVPANLSAFTDVAVYTSTNDEIWHNVAGYVDGAGDSHIVAECTSATGITRERLLYWKRTSGGVVTGPSIWMGFRLMSRPFVWRGRAVFLASSTWVSPSTSLPFSTMFAVDLLTGALIGRALPAIARGGHVNHAWQPHTSPSGNDLLYPTAYLISGTQYAAALVRIRPPVAARYLEIADCTLIPSTTIHMYDGLGLTELGFHMPPERTSVTATAGGGLSTGTYWYRATWAWVDAAGRLHESAPSDAWNVAIVNPGTGSASNVFKSLAASLKRAPVKQPVLRLWRSTASPSAGASAEFRLVTTVVNDPSVATFTISDTMSDATLLTKERLYTIGNTVLANTTPPPANGLCAWNDRAWAWERDVVWFSKRIADDYGVAFSDEQYVQISDDRGDVVVAADAGQRLAIFKATAIYVLSGDGPNDLGAGSFSPVRRLPFPLGARSELSTVSTELGVFFQDDASGSIWLLPPDGAPRNIGREIDDIAAGLTITESIVVPVAREVRFFSSQGTTLVYDMTHETWRTFTEQPAVAACVVDGVVRYARADGDIYQADPTSWTEGKAGVVVPDVDPMLFTRTLGAPGVAVTAIYTAPLPACTPAGSGVGKTLTANANGALAGAGAGPVLVAGQADPRDNGVYAVTAAGSAGAPWVLTRATTFDTSAEAIPGTLVGLTGDTVSWRLNDGYPYQAVVETSWLSMGGLGGYQRTYAVQAIGEELGSHVLTCELGYRFGSEEERREIDTDVLADEHGYRVEARPSLRHQQATSLRVRLEDDSPPGPGFALEALALTVGLRGTRARAGLNHVMTPEDT